MRPARRPVAVRVRRGPAPPRAAAPALRGRHPGSASPRARLGTGQSGRSTVLILIILIL